jgi:hypothetical protein
MKTILLIFLISDLLFPIWWIIIMLYLMKKKRLKAWQAWGIAATLCVTQAYLVAKLIGWNLGGYLIILIASIPSIIFGESQQETNYWFWLLPPVVLILIPSLLLYLIGKYRNRTDKTIERIKQENA